MNCEKCSHSIQSHGLSCLLCSCNLAQWQGNLIDWKAKRYHDLTMQEDTNSKRDLCQI